MKKLVIASSLAIASFAATAQTYVELGVTAVDYKTPNGGGPFKAKPRMMSVLGGYELSEHSALEAMLGFGLSDSALRLNSQVTGEKLEIKHSYAVFVKPKARLTEQLEVFGRLGFARATISITEAGATTSTTDTDLAYGLGALFYIGQAAHFTANYMHLYKKDSATARGLTLGLGYRF